MEFIQEYWPIFVCVILIIVAIVLLIVFRDKKDTTQDVADVRGRKRGAKYRAGTRSRTRASR